jgi:cysteine desulfurase
MAANHEIGTLQPMEEIGRIAAERGVLFHTDATQAVGKVAFDVGACGVRLASLSAHKIYGPKGCGALYVDRRELRVRLRPLQFGGDHERRLRPGTQNVPGIVGLGRAAELCLLEREEEARRVADLRDRLLRLLREGLDGVSLHGPESARLPGNLNVGFSGTDNETLMAAVPEVAVSSGSACTTGAVEPSRVLRALGLGEAEVRSAIRFGLGRFTTGAEIETAAERLVAAVRKLRARPRR